MITKINSNKIRIFKNVLSTILIICIGFITIYYSQATSKAVKTGVIYCTDILIPSLFPIMFLSKFIVTSNMLEFLKKPLDKIMKILFYLPGSTAPVILLSLIGGYPIGAIGVQTLFKNKEINQEQLNRMMYFCVNAGPAFIINIIGTLVLKNKLIGLFILIVQIFTSLLIGIVVGLVARLNNEPYYSIINKDKKTVPIIHAFLESTYQISNSIISMCSLVILFNVFISIINNVGILNLLSNVSTKLLLKPQHIICLIISTIEITCGCSYASNNPISLFIISFMLSYAGICTHLQIISILKNTNFNYKKFNFVRLLSSVLTSLSTYLLLNIFEIKKTVFLSNIKTTTHASISCSRLGSLAIIILCICFIISLHTKNHRISSMDKSIL